VGVCACVRLGEGRQNWQFLTKIMVERQMSETDFEARFVSAYRDANSINRTQLRNGNVHKTTHLP
jgi:hypothetical protein